MKDAHDTAPTKDSGAAQALRDVGLRPTQQRLALAELLFSGPGRHITAERLYEEATLDGAKVSLATIYNTLNQFKNAGLLREVIVDSSKSYFDTVTTSHLHLYDEQTGEIIDLHCDFDEQHLRSQIDLPPGKQISGIDVVVRIRSPHTEE